jgi:uncharacterized protein YjlB
MNEPSKEFPFGYLVQTPSVLYHLFVDDGIFPNNEHLPLLVYQNILTSPARTQPEAYEELFAAYTWGSLWRDGIYEFHHYHSTAHEVLGVYGGTAKVRFGGARGVVLSVGAGDMVIIPAGVAHKNVGASQSFRCVGAYPRGQSWDMNYGKEGERPQADRNIARVPLPQADPVYGIHGPLIEYWRAL